MKIIKKLPNIVSNIIVSVYLVLLLYSQGSVPETGQLAVLFIYFILCFFITGKLIKSIKIHVPFRFLLLSAAFAAAAVVLHFDSLKPVILETNKIEVTALGEKNIQSAGSEVWLTKIILDGIEQSLDEIPLPEGWFYKEGVLVSYPSETPYTFHITLPGAETIELWFLEHPWSGKVRVIENGNASSEYDLYGSEDGTWIYKINGKVRKDLLSGFITLAAGFLIFYSLFLFSIRLALNSRKYIALPGILYTWLAFSSLPGEFFRHIGLLIGAAVSFLFSAFYKKREQTRTEVFFTAAVSLAVCFLLFGTQLFFTNSELSLMSCLQFLLLWLWLLPFLTVVLELLQKCSCLLRGSEKQRKKKPPLWLRAVIAVMITLLFSGIYYQTNGYHTQETEIVIHPAGQKNKQSQGFEVLLGSVVIDGVGHLPEEFGSLPEGWTNLNGIAKGDGSTDLILRLPKAEDIKLIFNKHTWSGIIEIRDGTKITTLDLYSDGSASFLKSYQVTGSRIYGIDELFIFSMFGIGAVFLAFSWLLINLLITAWIEEPSVKRFFITVSLEILFCLGFYVAASYPAAICVDGRTQLLQAMGHQAITDAHPAIYTLLIKGTMALFHSAVGIVLLQVVFFTLVVAGIITYLYSAGMRRRVLLIFGAVFSLTITHGIYVTTIWKDVPYSIFILWLTYLIYRIGREKEYLLKPWNLAALTAALAGVRLFRHNGIVVFLLIIVLLFFWGITRKKLVYFIAAIAAVITVGIVRGPVYTAAGVESVEQVGKDSSSAVPLIHGLVYVLIEDKLDADIRQVFTDIMPTEEWMSCYTPYSANELYLSEAAQRYQVKEKLSGYSTSQWLKYYLKTFFKEPFLIVKDRLLGCELAWNVVQDSGYNWRIANNSFEIGVVDNELAIYRRDNLLTNIFKPVIQATMNGRLTDTFFWRAGIWHILFLLLALYQTIQKKWRGLAVFIPCAGNLISLYLSMAWQDFRYVYFMNLCVPLIALLVLSENFRKLIEEKQRKKEGIV